MLQNVHRGGQGQTVGLANLYELATSSSPSSPSPSPSFASALLTQQRPTTYRPLLRREDQIQVVQAIDYRIPKSLQHREPLAQQLHRLQPASPSAQTEGSVTIAQYGDDVSNLDDASTYQDQLRSGGLSSLIGDQPAGQPRSRSQLTGEPQANSYARLLRFQGDRRLDSFVRY